MFFKNYYSMIAIELSKQPALDAHRKEMQQTNFTGNLDQAGSATIFFIIEEANKTILGFSQRTVKVLWIYFTLIKYQYKMVQYNTSNVKLSNSQLNKWRFAEKNGTEVILKIYSNAAGDSINSLVNGDFHDSNFLHKLILTNKQVSKIRKAFVNNYPANKILSKT